MMKLTEKERSVLTALQCGIEPVARPFRGLALPETEVVALLQRARAAGLIRRFGGVFDARRLGYQSILCAMDPAGRDLEAVAAVIARHPGVTHCYERRPLQDAAGYPALWFTLAMLREAFDEGLAALRAQLPGERLLLLPALRRFKIDVVFDLRTRDRDEQVPGGALALPESSPAACPLNDRERALVRLLDELDPVSARPFDQVAGRLGQPVREVTARLQRWRQQGLLRRIAAVLRHREAGFTVNGMCVWSVGPEAVAAGRRVAACRAVTHCYQRPRLEEFPFDLYAMIHAASRPEAVRLYQEITAACGLPPGMMFVSLREFKKTSMKYFSDAT
ncbi:MAG: hypothetical protein LC725_12605 [Lentisphaerae bacterium]|nr:hypothetical protein [Lentisphaerota bacterium]